jgi:hypothetical protein
MDDSKPLVSALSANVEVTSVLAVSRISVSHKMSEEKEQSMCIKFCVKLGKNGVETLKMLKTAYGENALSRTTVFGRHKMFFDIEGIVHYEYIPILKC